MNVIDRFTLRSMKANRKWTAVTLIGIIISTAMISAVSTFCVSLIDLMRNEAIASQGNWHAAITGVSVRDVQRVRDADFAGEVMLSRDIGYAALEGSKNQNKPYLFIRQADEAAGRNFPTQLLEGRMPERDGEIALPRHMETNGGVRFKVGDVLELSAGRRMAPDGRALGQNDRYQGPDTYDAEGNRLGETLAIERTLKVTVVGIVARPSFEPMWAPGYTAFVWFDAGALSLEDSVTVTILAKRPGRGIFRDAQALARDLELDASAVRFNEELLRYSGIVASDNVHKTIYGTAAVIVAIIMAASASLIYNAFAISVSERVGQLGMLASVGATKRQKRRSVYFEGFLLGMVGIPVGIAAGIFGIGVTLEVIRPLLEDTLTLESAGLELRVSLLSIAVAAALAWLTILVSAWLPARRASGIMPIDAIRQSKEVRLTRKVIRTSAITRALFGFEGELARKNLKRSRRKYRATVLSLAISLVLFLTVSQYAHMIGHAADATAYGLNYDLRVMYFGNPRERVREINEAIAALDGVGETLAAESVSGFFAADEGQMSELTGRVLQYDGSGSVTLGANVYCPDDAAFDRYARSLGAEPKDYRDLKRPRMILINYMRGYFEERRFAGEIFSIAPGEILRFSTSISEEGEIENGVELEAGIVTDQRPMGVLVSGMYDVRAVVSREVFDALQAALGGDPNEARFEELFIRTQSGDAVETRIQELAQGLEGRTNVTNVAADARRERNMMLVVGVFVYGFIILISLICIANIFNTVTTNIALRRREFAMLRSVGMTPKSFSRMIRFESVFYGVNALVWGLPIGAGVSLLLYRLEANALDAGFSVPWQSYCAAAALIFIIVGATMLYSSARIRRENIIDALKMENM